MNHTCFLKDYLPDWAHWDNEVKKGDRLEGTEWVVLYLSSPIHHHDAHRDEFNFIDIDSTAAVWVRDVGSKN